jgi:hypothetical protein
LEEINKEKKEKKGGSDLARLIGNDRSGQALAASTLA